MPIGVKAKNKSSKKRDAVSQQAKTGSAAKNQSVKGASLIIHQAKSTSRKAYSTKNRHKQDLKAE